MPIFEGWFVWREDGMEMPRHKHTSLDSAQHEACRLAADKPGVRFIVLKVVGCAALPKPEAQWEDAIEDDVPF